MACYAVKCLTVPAMPNNEGAVAPIRVSAPPDSILNAQPPYPKPLIETGLSARW